MRSIINKRLDLTVEEGCLFWSLRAVIPESMKKLILSELNLGIVNFNFQPGDKVAMDDYGVRSKKRSEGVTFDKPLHPRLF